MVDLSFLEKFTRGNPVKMKRYIAMYLKIAPEIFERMTQNVEQKDWKTLAINAHSLKPQTDYMGIATLKEVLISIESKANEGEYNELENLLKQAFEIHTQSIALLNSHIEDL